MQHCYGKILKNARKARKKTQEQVAEFLNISPAAYQTWEAGTYRADEHALLKLEEFLEDKFLAIRYLEQASPVWQAKAQPLITALAIRDIHDKLLPLIPHLAVFIDTISQLAS